MDWDLVIVDEAHKMAAYKYGSSGTKKTKRYRLGEVFSETAEHLLFLTATPHKGDPENFRLFLDLLVPGFFATKDLIEESLINRDNPLFIRRMKEDLKDFEGRPLFTNRFVKTIKFRLSEEEKRLYNELSKYVISQYNKALQCDRRGIAFALLILQRRMASSVYALLKSLERRKRRLLEILKEPSITVEELPRVSLEEYEDFEERKRWEIEKKWETISLAKTKEELEKEIMTIDMLIEMAKEVIRKECEVKLQKLKEVMRSLRNEKILIFTESRDTLEYLVNKIRSWGYSVNFIHGGMSLEDRIKAEKVFKHETQVMVATEAAGEGINLQFCHIMINYDIPWNPTRLEQRMGRIHRYGQQKDVYVFNFVAEDTREGQVLAKLFDKLEEIRRALGSDKVFDVIGDVFYGRDIYKLIVEAAANARSLDEIIRELDIKVDEEYIAKVKEALGESLATRYIDYTRIREMAEKAREYRLIPEYVEEFFKRAFEKAGGKIRVRKDGFIAIDSIPYEIRRIAEEYDFKNKYGVLARSYRKITFDKDIAFKNPDAEFVSFGHPLFEAVLEWVNRNFFSKMQRGAVFKDVSGRYNGIIWFFVGEVVDGRGEVAGKKLMAIYDDGKTLREVNPAILWDLLPSQADRPINVDIDEALRRAQEYAIELIEKYREDLLEERKRQAEIKRKYGLRSLDYLIRKLDEDLVELYEREAKGEKVRVAIRNKEERKRRYEEAREELIKEIEQETSLSISMPKLLGAILVEAEPHDEMASDEDIERIGMEIAMEYERNDGMEPEDVSKENLGYDIRSVGKGKKKGEIRYIEVKARRDEGPVALTPNEWFKAKRFKDQYWLYIVVNATTNPTLYRINNPAERLSAEKKIEVRYIISPGEWKRKGIKVEDVKKAKTKERTAPTGDSAR